MTLTDVPTKADVRAVLPDHVFEPSTMRSMRYAVTSTALVVIPGVLAWRFLPLSWAWLPAWVLYALVVGTLGTGAWVIAHECGHGAFSKNKKLQDAVGFVLHSGLLVPYFSWQRSHALHHAKTNHVTEGETHVPLRADCESGARVLARRNRIGRRVYAWYNIIAHLLVGWPVYLLTGATPGDAAGRTNHFWPWKPFTNRLFPARFTRRVIASTLGVATVVTLLTWWAVSTSPWLVLAVYVGPYLVNNAWLVTYTWLHHTGPDTLHYAGDDWSYVRGGTTALGQPTPPTICSLAFRIITPPRRPRP